jgi:hypothetical protein
VRIGISPGVAGNAMENGKKHLRGSLFTTQFTCFTRTKVQILTPEALRGRQEAPGLQAYSLVSSEGGAQNHVAQVQKYTDWYTLEQK